MMLGRLETPLGRLTWNRGTYKLHPFGKENDLNQTSMITCKMLILRGVPRKVDGMMKYMKCIKMMELWIED